MCAQAFEMVPAAVLSQNSCMNPQYCQLTPLCHWGCKALQVLCLFIMSGCSSPKSEIQAAAGTSNFVDLIDFMEEYLDGESFVGYMQTKLPALIGALVNLAASAPEWGSQTEVPDFIQQRTHSMMRTLSGIQGHGDDVPGFLTGKSGQLLRCCASSISS